MSRRSAAASDRSADAVLRFVAIADLRSSQTRRVFISSSCARNALINCMA